MLSICLLFTFAFCTKKENQIDNAPKFFGFKSIDEARSSLGKYADLFVAVDGSIYQSSMKTNNSTTEDWDLFARFNSNPLSSTRTDGGDFFLNSIKLIFDKISSLILFPDKAI